MASQAPAGEPSFSKLRRPGRLLLYVALAGLAAFAVYAALSRAAGFSDTFDTFAHAEPGWLAAAIALTLISIACYVLLFHRLGATSPSGRPDLSRRLSAGVAFAGLGAATLISAGGAGALALEYWALRRVGVARREAALRVGTFVTVLYSVYLGAVVVAGLWLGLGMNGERESPAITLLPAALAAAVVGLFLFAAVRPNLGSGLPAAAARPLRVIGSSTRRALSSVSAPWRAAAVLAAAIGYWAANVATLGVCFLAFGEHVPVAVLVQGFFVGMVANLLPLLPGGAGTVDAGLIGALAALGEPVAAAIAAVLAYRLIAYWLPTPFEFLVALWVTRELGRGSS